MPELGGRTETRQTPGAPSAPRFVAARLCTVAVSLVIILVLAHVTDLTAHVDVDRIRDLVSALGALSAPMFVLAYGVAILAHVPGSVFVGAGVLAYGFELGLCWSFLGALWGNLLTFGLVRATGYRPRLRRRVPWVERISSEIARRPTTTVAVVRLVFPTTAPVNYALALTSVPLSAYLVGSAIGVVPQLVATAAVFGAVFDGL
jgi:uncharacterized membrane protein YdjX (TVP38/TMEM64 family)